MPRETLRSLMEYRTHLPVTTVYPGYVDTPIHDRSRAAGVALDGLVPAERVRDTVLTVVRSAAAPRPPRDVAATPLGTAALLLARHAPPRLRPTEREVIGHRLLLSSAKASHDPLTEIGLSERIWRRAGLLE